MTHCAFFVSPQAFGRLWLSLIVSVERCCGSNRTLDEHVIWRRDVASLLTGGPSKADVKAEMGQSNADNGRVKAEKGRRGGDSPLLVPPHSVLGPLHFKTEPFKVSGIAKRRGLRNVT
jgi:hypothetical protein